nr:hypothetical protein [uncultured Butyrivibrio sp.]
MGQFDLEKLDKALIYVNRIADGKNPINNMPADNDDVMNDPNVIRCMFFIKDVLLALKENGGVIGKTSGIKKKEFPMESLSEYQFIETKTITRFTEQLNSGIDEKEYKKLSYKVITDWLKKNSYLIEKEDNQLNKKVTLTTEKGQAVGITHSLQTSMNGTAYYRIEYDKMGQEFVLQNLSEIIKSQCSE